MADVVQDTMAFRSLQLGMTESRARRALLTVYRALEEKGYNPMTQLVGYLLSGDPTYITSHSDARNIIKRLDRDEILEELVTGYLKDVIKQP